MTEGNLNVKRFGAKGNGKTDDTRAIQKTLDEASQAVLTRQDTHDIPYPNGIPSRCGYHYHSTGPEVFFPPGHYVISEPILPRKALALRGEGHPWIEQKDNKQDIIYCEESIRQSFAGLAFHGGRTHLNLGNSNEDNGQIRIEDCKFYGSKATAIQVRKNSNSTVLLVLGCQIVGCEQAVVSWNDITHIRDGWLAGGCSGDGALLVNRHDSLLTVDNLCCVPMVNGYDQRWVDNHGTVVCRNVRFGGEEGGFTPIVNFARHTPLSLGCMVILDSCWAVCGIGNAKRACAVYCEEIPNLIDIRNCSLNGIPPVLISKKIDPKTYFMAKPDMLKFRLEGNIGELSGRIPAMLKKPRLNPPKGPKVMSDKETLTALKQAKTDWLKQRTRMEETEPGEYQGHPQRTSPGEYIEISPSRYKWDLNDRVDGTSEKCSRYHALAPVPGGVLVMMKSSGGFAHVSVRKVTIDLDRFPYLTWRMIPTGSPANLAVRIMDRNSGRSLLLESYMAPAGYRAYNLRELLKSGGKHTLNIKLYYIGVRYKDGTRRTESILYAKAGDYMVIAFLRAEK
ncbi:MAG: glycosyl hydrolase family 28-related protein [Candidatus Omnitrophota bacterium]